MITLLWVIVFLVAWLVAKGHDGSKGIRCVDLSLTQWLRIIGYSVVAMMKNNKNDKENKKEQDCELHWTYDMKSSVVGWNA